MEKTNADHVLKKLRKISFPLPRGNKRDFENILKEVEYLEKSLSAYKSIIEKQLVTE